MFLIPLAIRIGDFSLFAPGNVGLLLLGATIMSMMTYGLFRWNRHATPDPFVVSDKEKGGGIQEKQPTNDIPIK